MINVHDLIYMGREDASPEEKKNAHRMVTEMLGTRVQENFSRFRTRQSCIRKAMEKPLPGNAGDAFLAGRMTVNERTIYEVVPTHVKILQALDSPLLKMAGEAEASEEKKASADFTEEQQCEICFIFTEPPRILRMLFKEKGIEWIRNSAHETWMDKPAAEITMTVTAAIVQYARHIRTTVEFAQEMEASGDKSFFRELAERHSKPKASAGS